MLWVPEGSFILVSCTNFASDHLLCGPVVNHRLIPINVPESADLCHVWPICACRGRAFSMLFLVSIIRLWRRIFSVALMSAVNVWSSEIAWIYGSG